jgi:uncharacterized membrane protein
MPTLSLFRRRDPMWEVDGPAARRARRQQRAVSSVAFATSLVAVGAAALAWALQLGLGGLVGVEVGLIG